MSHRCKFVSILSVAVALAGGFAGASSASAAAFTAGDIVVSRVGDGSVGLGSTASAVFLDEYNPVTNQLVQTISLPVTDSTGVNTLTLTGNATSEGFLRLTSDGSAITIVGYQDGAGSANPSSTTAINRVIGLVNASGVVDTTTQLTNANSSVGSVRSAAVDGTKAWIATAGEGVEALTAKTSTVRVTSGAGATRLSGSGTNNISARGLTVFNGQLYVSSASQGVFGVATVGTGEPTSAGASGQAITILPGFPTATGPSPYDYFFVDSTDMYVADDSAGGEGIQKWTFNGSSWVKSYNLASSGVGFRGLTGVATANGVQLYATGYSTASPSGTLYSVLDNTALGGTPVFNAIASAGTNEAFRGVAFVPTATPEPASLGLLVVGGLLLVRRRR